MRRARLLAAISAAALCISMVGNVPMVSMAQEEARVGTEAFASAEVEAETEAASGAEVETGTNAATGTDAGIEVPGIADEEEAIVQEAVCEEISGEESSELTASVTDFEYSDNEDGTVTITKYKGSDTEVVIPAKISGKHVTAIGDNAFNECGSLTSVEIPSGVTSIGSHAFFICVSLEKIELPSGVTSIGDYAFGCSALTSIEIPATVTNIGNYVFMKCGRLTSVKVAAGNANYVVSNGILYTKNMTDLVWCPMQKKGTVRIPAGVTRIWDGAFADCTGLTNIEFPSSLTSIGQNAFKYCSGLTSIEIPEGVTSIGLDAFGYCTGLTSIKIPEGVTSIGSGAFWCCTGLTKIELPASLRSLSNTTFRGCSKMSSVEVAAGNANYTASDGILYTKDMTQLIYCPEAKEGTLGIPSGVTSIGMYAFNHCNLTSIEIPSSVTNIQMEAFSNSENLTSVIMHTGVTRISDYAFSGCDKLTIYGLSGTRAEAYAKERKIPFAALPEDNDLSKFTVHADDAVYNGYYQTPELYMEYDGKRIPLIEGSSYTGTVSRKAAGTTTVTIKGTGYYTGETTVSFTVNPLNLKNALEAGDVVLTATDLEYTGRLQQSTVKVTYNGKTLTEGTDYTLKGNGRKAVGTSWAVVTGTGNYKGTIKVKYAMKKASQSNMMVYTKDKRAVDVRTQGATIQLMTSRVRDGAKIVYSVEQPNQGITVSSSGKVTVKKGTKPGKYRIKVLAESTPYYKATSKYFTVVVK